MGVVQRPSPFLFRPLPGRERVLRTGGKKHIRESATILHFGFLGSFYSENESTRGVLIDDTAAIYNSSNRYVFDNMSCARAIGDTAGKNIYNNNSRRYIPGTLFSNFELQEEHLLLLLF